MKQIVEDAAYWLRKENLRLKLELQAEKDAHTRTLTALLHGEQIRDRMKLHAILNGAYNHLATTEPVRG